jgi:putative hydrolase of HD superfamily
MTDDQPTGDSATVAFLHEVGHLKNLDRAGWRLAGIKDPESVAEHSFRVAVIAYVLAAMEGCNPERAAVLALFHDLAECRIGDVPSVGKPHVRTAEPEDVIAEQVAHVEPAVANPIVDAVVEFEAKETPEAVCAKDADKLECLLQAREYEARGNPLVRPWVDSMARSMRTESGRRLTAAALETAPDSWWRGIVAAYGTQPPVAG